jgi:spore coat protein CotH
MHFLKYLLLWTLLLPSIESMAQNVYPKKGVVFNDDIVPRVDILINKDSLSTLIDEANVELDHEYQASFIWNDGSNIDTVENIGFRLRGNTSRVSAKKSFKIKFTYFGSKKFHGLTDLNLNGEHNDPSIIRSKLNWDIMQLAGLEGPRANHVRLYINGEYRGLYINVENIDEAYFKKRNKDANGQLFKCYYGSDLTYLGNNPAKYNLDVYQPTNHVDNPDIWKLIDFTEVLSQPSELNFRCKLEPIFDVDDYLKRMAFEVLIGHWDNLVYNTNNAYLYFNPISKKMEILSFDLDNTYGIDWFKEDWSTRNIYSWSKSGKARPIYTNLLSVPEYKKRYGYYIKKMLNDFFNPTFMNAYIEKVKSRIAPYVANDTYAGLDYGYDFEDFNASFEKGLGQHVPLGIKEYIKNRYTTALSQLQNTDIIPFISEDKLTWDNEKVKLHWTVTSPKQTQVTLHYRFDNDTYKNLVIMDDGISPDTLKGDGNFAIDIPKGEASVLDYYFAMTTNTAPSGYWPSCGNFTIPIKYKPTPKLYVNEFMTDNTLYKDDAGEYEDWIELYNGEATALYIGDKYITDDAQQPNKWKLPELDLEPHSFLVLWADEDQAQDFTHTNFKLSKSGEFIGIYDSEDNIFAPIDTFSYGAQQRDKSYGRYPDGIGEVVALQSITIGASNVLTNSILDSPLTGVSVFPTIATDKIKIMSAQKILRIAILDSTGKTVLNRILNGDNKECFFEINSLQKGSFSAVIWLEGKKAIGRFVKI